MITVLKEDITKLTCDAIVNAANNSLLGGGGVDGAIHRAAGPELLEECKTLNGCKTGDAKITKGYNLPSKFIIHTVAPIWFEGEREENIKLLESCYERSFEIAKENNLKTIAFPCLGMGVYMVPLEVGAKVAVNIAKKYEKDFDEIYLACFDEEFFEYYLSLI